ncbi:hypothetical protein, partial [Yoonia sp. 67]|uniref:hypothetical protein n=1 Tax=Yoonia sp. 67 TaxID=3081449 RepID=UPI002AFE8B2E
KKEYTILATQSIKHVPEHKHINHFSDHIARIQSYTYLANAIFHLSDQAALDERTHFITWPIPNRHLMQQKKYFLVRVIKNLIKKIDRSTEWGIIVSGDIGGTRYKSPRTSEANQAHLHATLILPLGFPVARLQRAIILMLLTDSERDGFPITTSQIDFRSYQPDQPYWRVIDYFNKGEKYLPLDWNLSPYIYPADKFRRNRRKTGGQPNIHKIRSFDAEIERVRDDLIFDPRRYFSSMESCGISDTHLLAPNTFEMLDEGAKAKFRTKLIDLIKNGKCEIPKITNQI